MTEIKKKHIRQELTSEQYDKWYFLMDEIINKKGNKKETKKHFTKIEKILTRENFDEKLEWMKKKYYSNYDVDDQKKSVSKVNEIIKSELDEKYLKKAFSVLSVDSEVTPQTILFKEQYNSVKSVIYKDTTLSTLSTLTFLETFKKFMDLRCENDYRLCTLWTIGVYLHDIFQHYPYLYLNAPKGSGKSKLIKLICWSGYRGIISTNMSGPALFHLIENQHPTVGFDEGELLSDERANDITNILLGGFEKGNVVYRVPKNEKGVNTLKEYDVFCPKIIGNIKGLSNDALESRCIPIRLLKTLDVEKANIYPERSDPIFSRLTIIGYVWAYENWKEVKRVYDGMKVAGDLVGRSFDLFRPLLAVCKVGFPEWYDEFLSYSEDKVDEIERVVSHDSQEFMILSCIKHFVNDLPDGQSVCVVSAKEFKENLLFNNFDGKEQRWLSYRWIGGVLKRLGLYNKRRMSFGVEYLFDVGVFWDVWVRYGGGVVEKDVVEDVVRDLAGLKNGGDLV